MPDGHVVIGVLGRPHGLRGALRARPTGATLATIAPGERVLLARPGGGEAAERAVAWVEGGGDRLRLALEGVDGRDAAAALTGSVVAVPAARVAVPADPDTFLVSDLVGCAVRAGDRPLGTVTDVHAGPANDALEVSGGEGTVLVPFTADAIVQLDLGARAIAVREGLVDA